MNTKVYIIGFGSGRCGTTSLAYMLDSCGNVSCSHEFRYREGTGHRIPWNKTDKALSRRIRDIQLVESDFVGDIAHYYLNYIPDLRQALSNIKFILLFRKKQKVINSFMRKRKEVGNAGHWLPANHPNFKEENYKKTKWSKTFPTYSNAENMRDAIGKYWEEYYTKAFELMKKFYDDFFLIKTKDLNKKEKLKLMYDFIGIPKENRNYKSVRLNRGRKN